MRHSIIDMKKYFIIIVLFSFQHLYSEDKSEILFAMDKYNKAFILADYDQIIENFIFPVSIITSEKIGVKKPDPKIFSFALTSAKANKDNSIMIGDDLKVDILGAENFGIRAVYFNPNMKIHNEKISFEIKNLDELISLF